MSNTKKLLLTAALSLFALSANAATSTIDNPFLSGSAPIAPQTKIVKVKSDGSGNQCKNLPKTCGQMVSCEQAKLALKCGNTKLDRDKDGVPCESICPGG